MVWTLCTRLFLEQWLRRDSGMVPLQPHEGDAQKGTLYPPTLPGPTLSSSHHHFAVLEPSISSPITCTDLESPITSHHSNPLAQYTVHSTQYTVQAGVHRAAHSLSPPVPYSRSVVSYPTCSHHVLPPSPPTTATSRWTEAPLPPC